tara:strand:+ start:1266 stop:2813 length:1548 start_codon:yes stop_codon:yes gene_type:complete
MLKGDYSILYIKLGGQFLPIGLLTSNSFSEDVDMIDSMSMNSASWMTSAPTNQGYNISFDGLVKNTNFNGGDFSKISLDRLRVLKRSGTLIEWKTKEEDLSVLESGFGHITSLSRSSTSDEFITFSANIEGFGQIKVGNALVIVLRTDNLGTSNDNQFTIATNPSLTYNYIVKTSDGQVFSGLTGDSTITFNTTGVQEISITGVFPSFYYNNVSDKAKITELKEFGFYSNSTTQLNAFYGCSNMVITATDLGDFSTVIDFTSAWRACTSLTSFPLIDTSSATNFFLTWNGCSSLTSFPLIDTSSVTNFTNTWANCSSLTSFPLIDTSVCSNLIFTWNSCSSLTSFPLIDTSSATNFLSCWTSCTSLTSFPLISTINVTNFSSTWAACTSLTSFPLINAINVTNFSSTWFNCNSLTSFPLIDAGSGTNFSNTWRLCNSLANFPANFFNSCLATNFSGAFESTNLSQTSIDNILVSIESNGTSNGTFNQSGGSNTPSATGVSAKNSLISRGWTVTTN